MNTRYSLRAGAVAAAALCIIAIDPVALAGDVNPPAGAVAPTMKTLDEVEPRIPLNQANTPGDLDSLYRITQPGSYYLTEDTDVRSSESGIEIATSRVTIDLMGFRLLGLNGSVSGIRAFGVQNSVTIRNGYIESFDSLGIDAFGISGGVFESIMVSTSIGDGFSTGWNSRVIGCRAVGNSGDGFSGGSGTVYRDCIANNNTETGFLTPGAVVIGCVAYDNGTDGFRGFGTYSQCVAHSNESNGFEVNGSGAITGCRARNNSENGIHISNGPFALSNCVSDNNTEHGFDYASGEPATFVGCSAGNNGLSGFNVPHGSTVDSCAADGNAAHGITGGYAMDIRGCTARRNTLDGIRVTYKSSVVGNTCFENGYDTGDGAGVHATGSENRIEANNVIDNDRGIEVGFWVNVIIRNSASGNTTNYDIAASNIVGPFVDASNIATDDSPHANYDY